MSLLTAIIETVSAHYAAIIRERVTEALKPLTKDIADMRTKLQQILDLAVLNNATLTDVFGQQQAKIEDLQAKLALTPPDETATIDALKDELSKEQTILADQLAQLHPPVIPAAG